MYSVVLMMAMTTGGDVADCHRGGGGCMGGGCMGGGCMGYVASCGCTGGGHILGGRRHGGGGCTGYGGGGCTGYGGGGCTGYGGGGCTGSHGIYGGCTGGGPGRTGEELKKMPKEEPKKTGMAPAPATLIVSLPADAKLMIDDTATTSTSSERTFVSPTLNPGIDYNYTLKAEVMRDGKKVQVEEKVTVRAGQETRVTMMPQLVAAR
jgi:uncharacterized protein (TIGR03000 family)